MIPTGKTKWFSSLLRPIPWYLLLLPLFFVVHGWKENFYHISAHDLVPLTAVYTGVAILLFLLSLPVFRNSRRAGIFTFALMSANFFFGAVQDTLQRHAPLLTHYSLMLGTLAILLIILFVWLKRTRRQLIRLNQYLNLVPGILLLIDAVTILLLPARDPDRFTVAGDKIAFADCTTCPKPDVYFLLCDEFASTQSLKETWQFDNSAFDTALTQRGFQVIPFSSSNYNFTPFSMASILNMDYLEGISSNAVVDLANYQQCNELIRRNNVLSFFESRGYDIRNYSVFDLQGLPSPRHQTFLPLKTRPITEQTLLNRVKRDLGHLLLEGRWRIGWLASLAYKGENQDSYSILSQVAKESSVTSTAPRFFYAHLFMPHTPYLYDSAGNQRSDSLVIDDYTHPSAAPYLESVTYSSRRLTGAIDTILRQSAQPPVIILMGDHGFRMQQPASGRKDYFRNMNAVYLPPGIRSLFPDSMTTVNQFRILLNSVYGQQLPLLKDSTILLTDK